MLKIACFALLVTVLACGVAAQEKDKDVMPPPKHVVLTARQIRGGYDKGDPRNPYVVAEMYGKPEPRSKNDNKPVLEWGCGKNCGSLPKTGAQIKGGTTPKSGAQTGAPKPATAPFTTAETKQRFMARIDFAAGSAKLMDFTQKGTPQGQQHKRFPKKFLAVQREFKVQNVKPAVARAPSLWVCADISPDVSPRLSQERAMLRARHTGCYVAAWLRKNGYGDFRITVATKGTPTSNGQKGQGLLGALKTGIKAGVNTAKQTGGNLLKKAVGGIKAGVNAFKQARKGSAAGAGPGSVSIFFPQNKDARQGCTKFHSYRSGKFVNKKAKAPNFNTFQQKAQQTVKKPVIPKTVIPKVNIPKPKSSGRKGPGTNAASLLNAQSRDQRAKMQKLKRRRGKLSKARARYQNLSRRCRKAKRKCAKLKAKKNKLKASAPKACKGKMRFKEKFFFGPALAAAVGRGAWNGAKAVGGALARGASAVGRGVGAAARAVGRGARAVGRGIGRAAGAVGRGVGRAAGAVGRRLKKLAKSAKKKLKNAKKKSKKRRCSRQKKRRSARVRRLSARIKACKARAKKACGRRKKYKSLWSRLKSGVKKMFRFKEKAPTQVAQPRFKQKFIFNAIKRGVKAVGRGARAAASAVGRGARAVGRGILKGGKKVGKFVARIFKRNKQKRKKWLERRRKRRLARLKRWRLRRAKALARRRKLLNAAKRRKQKAQQQYKNDVQKYAKTQFDAANRAYRIRLDGDLHNTCFSKVGKKNWRNTTFKAAWLDAKFVTGKK